MFFSTKQYTEPPWINLSNLRPRLTRIGSYFNAVRVFSDGAGVGRATSSDREQAYFIAPDIIDLVYYASQGDSSIDDDSSRNSNNNNGNNNSNRKN